MDLLSKQSASNPTNLGLSIPQHDESCAARSFACDYPMSGNLIDSLTETVARIEQPQQISPIDGERCMHETGWDQLSEERLLCSVRTGNACDSCGETYCPRHMALHKRWYCMGILRGGK